MLEGTGFAFAVGFVSASILAALAFLIWLKLNPVPSDLTEAVARAQALAGKVAGSTGKVESSTDTLKRVEPGDQ